MLAVGVELGPLPANPLEELASPTSLLVDGASKSVSVPYHPNTASVATTPTSQATFARGVKVSVTQVR